MSETSNIMFNRFFGIILLVLLVGCSTDYPKEFSEKALQDMVYTVNDEKLTFREVLYQNKGKTILIDVWASWCKDCIVGFPKLKKIQAEFPEVTYLFLSVDRGSSAWKRAIIKYNLKGLHYNFPKGQNNGDFVEFINLGWIPRYMVIDKEGKITLFKATNASDKNITQALKAAL